MRILVVTPTFLPALGGAELVILQVYRRLAEKHSVLVLTPHLHRELIEKSGSNDYDHLVNFPVERYHDRVTFMKIRLHRMTLGLFPPFSLSAVAAVGRAAKEFEPDVINVHYVMPTGLAGLYAQKKLNIPVVVTYNGRDVPGPGVPPLWKYWHRLIGRHCADMTFVSRYCRDVIYGRNASEGHVVYNGVESEKPADAADVSALRAELNIHDGDKVLFALQRLDCLKRTDVIIRSLPHILRACPETKLVVGGKGEDMLKIERLAGKLNLTDNVVFTGFIPDSKLPAYYAVSDLFVFHSTYETFGMVLAEAMNYGKPIVSVRSTAISEVVKDGQTGILVPPLDPHAFATAVVSLLNESDRRKSMGEKGRQKAQSAFSWDTIAPQYERVLEEAVRNNSERP